MLYWFEPEHQMRGKGELSIITGMTKDIMSEYSIDPKGVYIAGMSAGGVMSVIGNDLQVENGYSYSRNIYFDSYYFIVTLYYFLNT
ncbi:esterase/PHB depolymerase [Bacillus oleivorans]|uniref:Esterase/PHB depolymerase n=1 Tax=Bacillus oleivorans TaxID=1448271 RepID=A0A285CMX9_9BACI|nr:PHB depolymerase family esterase [Bacillus oleivorans]SNX68899.1 esterase/PHB depolymerase [Bacillus oleivorans]